MANYPQAPKLHLETLQLLTEIQMLMDYIKLLFYWQQMIQTLTEFYISHVIIVMYTKRSLSLKK